MPVHCATSARFEPRNIFRSVWESSARLRPPCSPMHLPPPDPRGFRRKLAHHSFAAPRLHPVASTTNISPSKIYHAPNCPVPLCGAVHSRLRRLFPLAFSCLRMTHLAPRRVKHWPEFFCFPYFAVSPPHFPNRTVSYLSISNHFPVVCAMENTTDGSQICYLYMRLNQLPPSQHTFKSVLFARGNTFPRSF